MLSYHHHSTGHRVIRVCCAAAAAHKHKPGHKHPHTDTTKVTHTYKDWCHMLCIVGLTRALSSSGPHKSQELRPCSYVSVLKTIKKKKSKKVKSCSFLSLTHRQPCLINHRLAGICSGKKKLFSQPESCTCVWYLPLMLPLKCVSLCDTLIMWACWSFH